MTAGMLLVERVKIRNTFKNSTAYGAEYVGLYTMFIYGHTAPTKL